LPLLKRLGQPSHLDKGFRVFGDVAYVPEYEKLKFRGSGLWNITKRIAGLDLNPRRRLMNVFFHEYSLLKTIGPAEASSYKRKVKSRGFLELLEAVIRLGNVFNEIPEYVKHLPKFEDPRHWTEMMKGNHPPFDFDATKGFMSIMELVNTDYGYDMFIRAVTATYGTINTLGYSLDEMVSIINAHGIPRLHDESQFYLFFSKFMSCFNCLIRLRLWQMNSERVQFAATTKDESQKPVEGSGQLSIFTYNGQLFYKDCFAGLAPAQIDTPDLLGSDLLKCNESDMYSLLAKAANPNGTVNIGKQRCSLMQPPETRKLRKKVCTEEERGVVVEGGIQP
jgi:hypothetical protein